MRPINSCSFNSSRYFGLFRSNVNGWGFFSPVLQRRSPLPFCLHGICSSLLSQLFHFGFQPSFSTEDTCKRRYYFFIITLTFFDLLGFFLVPFLIQSLSFCNHSLSKFSLFCHLLHLQQPGNSLKLRVRCSSSSSKHEIQVVWRPPQPCSIQKIGAWRNSAALLAGRAQINNNLKMTQKRSKFQSMTLYCSTLLYST